MLDLIICANFGVKKLRGLGNTWGQILEFPIEMAGHPLMLDYIWADIVYRTISFQITYYLRSCNHFYTLNFNCFKHLLP